MIYSGWVSGIASRRHSRRLAGPEAVRLRRAVLSTHNFERQGPAREGVRAELRPMPARTRYETVRSEEQRGRSVGRRTFATAEAVRNGVCMAAQEVRCPVLP